MAKPRGRLNIPIIEKINPNNQNMELITKAPAIGKPNNERMKPAIP